MKNSISSRFSIDFPLFSHCLWRISASLSTAGSFKTGPYSVSALSFKVTFLQPVEVGDICEFSGGLAFGVDGLPFGEHTKNYPLVN